VRHGFDEQNTEVCPKCGEALVRNFNPSSIVFKGSGFYVNDSRSSGEKSSTDAA
jgi:predicted nucleic acid-binding Zn ribbon protein